MDSALGKHHRPILKLFHSDYLHIGSNNRIKNTLVLQTRETGLMQVFSIL